MPDREKVIKALEFCTDQRIVDTCYGECPYAVADDEYKCLQMKLDALSLLKEQEAEISKISSAYLDLVGKASKQQIMPWNVLGKLDDGTYKGKCGNCGFVHYFIEGHDAQYRFCPQCGEQKMI